MSGLCGYTLVDKDGEECPCDRPATGWRRYQDAPHEDVLAPACDLHANEGGWRIHDAEGGWRIHDAESKVARVLALADRIEAPALQPALNLGQQWDAWELRRRADEIRAAVNGEDRQ